MSGSTTLLVTGVASILKLNPPTLATFVRIVSQLRDSQLHRRG